VAELFSKSNVLFMLDGLKLTIIISVATIVLSIILGTMLALVRNYCKGTFKIFAILTTAYIELFRCTPNVLWILMLRFSIKGDPVFIGILSFTLFTSAVVAEIIRGGLNSIPKGQFEGAQSQGFHFFQTLFYIVLPQTYKAIIPALLSQCTTIIKDTSFLKAVDIHEFMRNSSVVLGSARGIAQICVLYGFVLFTYFLLNFALSLVVRAYHTKTAIS
jgi:putative glutamine transport system permease protein